MSTTRAPRGVERIAEAFAASGKRAALMPYVMGGFPTLAESLRIGEACVQAGADVIELGVPYSDPLADGPVIHAAGTQALAAGASARRRAGGGARAVRERAGGAHVLREHGLRARRRGVRRAPRAQPARSGLIVPDLPQGEAPEVLDACDALRARARAAGRARRRRPSAWRRSGPARAASSTRCRSSARPASASALGERFADVVARAKASTDGPGGRSASGSPRPSRPPGGRRGRRRRDRRHAAGARRRRGRGPRRGAVGRARCGWRRAGARRACAAADRSAGRLARIPRAWD